MLWSSGDTPLQESAIVRMKTDKRLNPLTVQVIKDFLKFCQRKLRIADLPVVHLHKTKKPHMTTGSYLMTDNAIHVLVGHRLVVDILRTIAHELTHRKQHEDGDLERELSKQNPLDEMGDLDTSYENDAYSKSGNYVKEFARRYKKLSKDELYSLHEAVKPPEAPPGEIFGQYLAATYRKDTPTPKEKETPKEEDFIADLNAHYVGMMDSLNKWIALIDSLKKKGKYTQFLKVPDKYKKAYRFMTVSQSTLETILGRSLTPEELRSEGVYHSSKGGVMPGRFGKRSHFSWTVDINVFPKIQKDWDGLGMPFADKVWFIVMEAPIKGNDFLLNPDILAKTDIPEAYGYQREVISVGDVKLSRVGFGKLTVQGELRQTSSILRMFKQGQ